MASDAARPETSATLVNAAGAIDRLSLHVSERKLLLGCLDVLLLNGALFVTLAMRLGWNFSVQPFLDRWPWFMILSGVWFVCAFLFRCYHLTLAADTQQSVSHAGGAVFMTSLIYLLIPYVTPALPSSRFDILAFPLLGFAGIAAWRVTYAKVLVQPRFHPRALIVGAGSAGQTLVQALNEMRHGPGQHNVVYQILGFVDDDPAKQRTLVAGVPVLGTHQTLVDLVQQHQPHELVVAITHLDTIHSALFEAILTCREMGISITTMAALYERLTGRVPIEHAGRALSVTMPLSQPATYRFYLLCQRLFDVAAGLLGSLLLLGLIPLVWVTNRLTSPGPLFYEQARVGKGGAIFYVIKFRSMVEDAEKATGAVWACENDPRITPIGRLLRRTRLDEIPQFWNILKGDMSLVGPRPERPHFVNQLSQRIPFYRVRHAVKPGLTGWAQVTYRYGASVEDAVIKLQYDLYYIKHQGPFLDLKILLKTIPVVLGFKGR